jgi:hypothetical protein
MAKSQERDYAKLYDIDGRRETMRPTFKKLYTHDIPLTVTIFEFGFRRF